jgi:hypothetical protein
MSSGNAIDSITLEADSVESKEYAGASISIVYFMNSILYITSPEIPRRKIELTAKYNDLYNEGIRKIYDKCLELKPDVEFYAI